ncbi:MAG TPA: Na+/H+ antiporter subunit A, partial [Corynebacterium glutamicum]|nr:Na+/H+ antiporter subunit A [Corynebacterium glutamicum]
WKAEPKQSRVRAWLAGATGLSVVIVTIFAMNARTTEPISVYMQDLAYEIGHGANTVNVLLVDLRGFDTFGEISVLVIAATGIASLVYRNRSFRKDSRRPTLATTGRRWLAAAVDTERAQNRSLMVDVATRILFPAMIMLSVYFFFAGHNAPGGGFAGGLVASLAFSLRYLAGGREELEEALPIDAGRILGTGLFVSATAVLWPMVLLGEPPLTSHIWDLTLPLIGEIHIASALLFDLGVYLIVIGLTMHILNSLGGQLDRDEEMRKQRARDRARRLARNQRREAATVGARRSNEKSTRQMPTIRPPGADTESVEQNGENQTSISTKSLKQEGK